MEAITTIITTLGFPIACVIACAWFIYTMNKQQREDVNSRESIYLKQIDKFSTSLDSFNETLIRIDARLESVEKKIDKME